MSILLLVLRTESSSLYTYSLNFLIHNIPTSTFFSVTQQTEVSKIYIKCNAREGTTTMTTTTVYVVQISTHKTWRAKNHKRGDGLCALQEERKGESTIFVRKTQYRKTQSNDQSKETSVEKEKYKHEIKIQGLFSW